LHRALSLLAKNAVGSIEKPSSITGVIEALTPRIVIFM
jgi:hypothetical protein